MIQFDEHIFQIGAQPGKHKDQFENHSAGKSRPVDENYLWSMRNLWMTLLMWTYIASIKPAWVLSYKQVFNLIYERSPLSRCIVFIEKKIPLLQGKFRLMLSE